MSALCSVWIRSCRSEIMRKTATEKIHNPYCIVSFLYWEASGKKLLCEKCIFADDCEKYRIAKEFQNKHFPAGDCK